jgi:hypothetical protein
MSLLDTKEGREALTSACRMRADWKDDRDCPIVAATGADAILSAVARMHAAYANVDDPAKLAELIAAEARRCGLDAAGLWICDESTARVNVYWARDCCEQISIYIDKLKAWSGDMTQARALVPPLLQLPNGAREDAERVLRGEVP